MMLFSKEVKMSHFTEDFQQTGPHSNPQYLVKKACKLTHHLKAQQKPNYSDEEIAFSPKDFQFLKPGDIVEIYNPDEDQNNARLLLKIAKGSLREDFVLKDTISVEQSIALTFSLKISSDVRISKVDAANVELDTLELTFRDQYLGRSEMWRFKNTLVDSCVYLNKKLEYCSGSIRLQVSEMWSRGDKVACGVVTSATKIVFRSSSSMVYLFIQMSSEMWEYDIYGDLYFEKAVNGFLTELFAKWKKIGSNHEVTIVLFSRVYYEACNLEQFPECMRECLQTDYKGRFYEDFYRVVIQNEKYEEWGNTLVLLRALFVGYKDDLLLFHSRRNPCRIPKAVISSAAQGNFLEVLNMSLNVFEKHYMDRSFDRTGQLSIVCTPSGGVFEVDRELTNVTMQRIIDNGVGSDLVCVGEQPLHAVPLLKFHSKATPQGTLEDYSMPHWINMSFYSRKQNFGFTNFTPRLKLPSRLMNSDYMSKPPSCIWRREANNGCKVLLSKQTGDINSWCSSVYDFDEYDEKVFKPHLNQNGPRKIFRSTKSANFSDSCLGRLFRRQNSEPEIYQTNNLESVTSPNSPSSSGREKQNYAPSDSSSSISIPTKSVLRGSENTYSSSFGALNVELSTNPALTSKSKWFLDDMVTHGSQRVPSPLGNSHGSPKDQRAVNAFSKVNSYPSRPSRALINPFDPSQTLIKLTSNRRRWTHIFPRGPSGSHIQQHHFQSARTKLEIVPERMNEMKNSRILPDAGSRVKHVKGSATKQVSETSISKRMLALMWGATGEQEWTPALTTGVDWKSLTIPACLPITTDYFPDDRSFQVDYLVSDYDLLPDDVNADYADKRAVYRRPLTTKEVFMELVSQRLAQGFQLIVKPQVSEKPEGKSSATTLSRKHVKCTEECFLSIGRIFHRITLSGSTVITVTRYRPRHPYPSIKIHYRYRFLAPNNENYEVSWTDFATEKLENYNWNFLDHYICTRGDRDFSLNETMKFWRLRMLISPTRIMELKKLMEGFEHFDIFPISQNDDKNNTVESFLKFIETCINRIRRPNNSFPKGASNQAGSTSGFRERVNSNRIAERPRIKSGSGKSGSFGSGRQYSGNGRVSPGETLETKNGQSLSSEQSLESICAGDNGGNSSQVTPKMKLNVSAHEIIEAMCSPNTGFSFIKSTDLPLWTFVSHDAIVWLMNHVEGISSVDDAVKKFNEMLKSGLICHASGDTKHEFVNGFYLYYVVTNSDFPDMESLKPHGDSSLFHNEWMEVEVQVAPNGLSYLEKKRENTIFYPTFQGKLMSEQKDVFLDVDVGKKSDRQEWGHARYQSVYKPNKAYEITVQWVQATGSVVTDLVQGWSRRAQQCNMQLIPVPGDPFALPYSSKSDPLRGPIFIPLAIDNIVDPEDDGDKWAEHVPAFQASIALKFGFILSPAGEHSSSKRLGTKRESQQYFHFSGNMFILVHTSDSIRQSMRIKDSPGKYQKNQESPSTSFHGDYITRHVSGKNKDSSFHEEDRVGFSWSWNYMVSKRWKTTSTPALGDENFMLRMLRDFQDFCSNKNNRLSTHWNTFLSDKK